jgi:YhcH/YjgK/YiaL family protein
MIFDCLSNFRNYCAPSEFFFHLVDFFNRSEWSLLTDGIHDIGNNGMHAIVSEYLPLSSENGFIECHKRFIDIHVMICGIERIGFCSKAACRAGSYDDEKDFQKLEGTVDWLTLRPGYFALFFPDDGHMPKMHCSEWSGTVKKMVIKAPVAKSGAV